MKIVNDALSNVEGFKKPKRPSSATKTSNKLAKDDLNINYKDLDLSLELTSEESLSTSSWINLDTFDKEGVSEKVIKKVTL